jgi:hypothetical protein
MCVGISRGKVLGCLVSVKGIKANPDKINAIDYMKPPGSREEVQRLIGRIAALNRLASSQPDQLLIQYVSATHTAVSRALVQEREVSKENKKISHQVPIYFVSEALVGSKKYYSNMEKYVML